VARAAEDYFPYKEGETYNMQKGNAAAHVTQALYNSIYFSQMVFPDFDMFQSHHPDAVYHALARTLNNGPVYLTDEPGKQNFDLLHKLVYADGKSIRSQTSLLPTEDCLFQVQQAGVLKAFSLAAKKGLLAVFNAADADKVAGHFSASDVKNLKGSSFAVYNYFSGTAQRATSKDTFSISLPRMGYGLYYIAPLHKDFASFGLINKYNAPATIVNESWNGNRMRIRLYEGGTFRGYSKTAPKLVTVNGKRTAFDFSNNLLDVKVPASAKPLLTIQW
jgi:raffinose synthase